MAGGRQAADHDQVDGARCRNRARPFGLDDRAAARTGAERLHQAGRLRQAQGRQWLSAERDEWCSGLSRRAGRHAMTRDRAGASSPESSEQGVVIVAVLWILMALSALTVILSLYLSASARALAVNDASLKIEALVSASLELTAYQLTLAGDEDRPQQGSFHFKMDAADTLVTF